MTTCIKCGAPIPDGELFCEACAMNGGVSQPRPMAAPSGRMQTPVRLQPRPRKAQPEPAEPAARQKQPAGRRLVIALLALLCLTSAYIAFRLYRVAEADAALLQSQQQTLDESEQELQALREENETVQTALAQNAELLQEQAGQLEQLQAQADFMDRNVVFVEEDGSGLYHRYGCSRFAAKTFEVYSRKQAAAAGYTACPDCG